MNSVLLIEVTAACSLLPALLFVVNSILYREPARPSEAVRSISVLIPARNEEASISAAVLSVLSSEGVKFEVIVLDDSSSDRTAEIVESIARLDSRVRLATAPALSDGWNGKQHACHVLASLAKFETFCFLDADVRIAPGALARMAAFQSKTGAALVSGFPFQQTGSFLEWLLLPLIHFVLLAYLPIAAMRIFAAPGLGAGCGQFIMVSREAYERSGGHGSIRTTMHDGIMLPQLLRKHGYRTDIADLTKLATCRMYHSASEVWNGLAKNATEGLAAPSRILFFSALLFFGQIAPFLLGALWLAAPWMVPLAMHWWIAASLAGAVVPRIIAAARFRQKPLSAVLHPVGVGVLLVLQWYALLRKLTGQPATWKQRAYNPS